MPKPIVRALFLSAGLALAGPAVADPVADAEAIAAMTMTPDALGGVLAAMRPMIVGSMTNAMREAGVQLSDPGRFSDIMMEEFLAGYLDLMRAEFVNIYLEEFTPDQLAAIAAFYRSDAGRALIAKTPLISQRGAQLGGRIGGQAGVEMADRLRTRLIDEGVTVTLTPEMQDRLLELLDQMATDS